MNIIICECCGRSTDIDQSDFCSHCGAGVILPVSDYNEKLVVPRWGVMTVSFLNLGNDKKDSFKKYFVDAWQETEDSYLSTFIPSQKFLLIGEKEIFELVSNTRIFSNIEQILKNSQFVDGVDISFNDLNDEELDRKIEGLKKIY